MPSLKSPWPLRSRFSGRGPAPIAFRIALTEAAFALKPAFLSDTTSAVAEMVNPKSSTAIASGTCKIFVDRRNEKEVITVGLLWANKVM